VSVCINIANLYSAYVYDKNSITHLTRMSYAVRVVELWVPLSCCVMRQLSLRSSYKWREYVIFENRSNICASSINHNDYESELTQFRNLSLE
jgi:hypothetical protein